MRNRETGLKVITTPGEPGIRNATSVTRDWHLLENDQGTSQAGVPGWFPRRTPSLTFIMSATFACTSRASP
ncbi:unnamed protein product [Lasius platythorax]|uniref:Uncharacterized protein n=1 Tax=Lasius platythorax TaxID=488582 RepID=A0AAV2NN21_9HYME